VTLDLLLVLPGVLLAWLTLRDVFDTVVVPGSSRASLQVTRRIGRVLLPFYKLMRGRKRGLSATFAPLVLVSSFVVWMALLAIAFGTMAYGARNHFSPPIKSFGDAIYEAGSALLTVGLSPHYPAGGGRWIILGSGFCGLALNFFAMLFTLSAVNLSLAAPASASLTYVGNAVAAKFFLHENVDRRRWLAVLCVCGGVYLLHK